MEETAPSRIAKQELEAKRTVVFAVWDARTPVAWLDRMGRNSRRVLKQKAAFISTVIARARISSRALAPLEKFVNEIAREVIDPERKISLVTVLRDERLSRPMCRTAQVRNRPDLHIEAGLRLRLFFLSSAPRHRLFGFGLAGRVGEAPIIPSTILSTISPVFIDPNSITASPSRKPPARAVLRLADADVLPSNSPISPRRSSNTAKAFRNSPMTCARYQKK